MPALSWCFVNEQEVCVGDAVSAKPIYRVTVTVPDGAPGLCGPLAERNRRTLVERVTEAVLEAEDTEPTMVEAHRVWVHLRLIDEGHWAGFGEVVTLRDLARYGFASATDGDKTSRMRAAALQSYRQMTGADPSSEVGLDAMADGAP